MVSIVTFIIILVMRFVSNMIIRNNQKKNAQSNDLFEQEEKKSKTDWIFVNIIIMLALGGIVIFSPMVATDVVCETNIFSTTKQYSETYNIVKMQDGDYYKVDKKKDGWKLSANQYDNATNTYTAREYNTENVWYGTTEDQPYVEVEFLEKKYEVPSWYTIAFLARSPEPEKAIHKITIYTPKEK